MYKNLTETVAHKKGVWSEVVVPKKHFLLCLIAGKFFLGSSVYFMKVLVAIQYLMRNLITKICEKKVKNWTACHFWRANDMATKLWKVV